MKKIYTERSRSIKNQTVEEFLNDLSSKSAAPGGGSVSALAGTMAAALVSMVCRLTIGKKKYTRVEREMKDILKKSEVLRNKLLDLAEEDAASYRKVLAAYESGDKKAIEKSLKRASEIPLNTCFFSRVVLRLAKRISEIGNKRVASDAEAARFLAEAALKGGLENVRINLAAIEDKKFRKKMRKDARNLQGGWNKTLKTEKFKNKKRRK